jgi:hypothetical protein
MVGNSVRAATSASARNHLVGIGGACKGTVWMSSNNEQFECDKTLGISTRIDAFKAVLVSIEAGLNRVVDAVYAGAISPRASGRAIHVYSRLSVRGPDKQSLAKS